MRIFLAGATGVVGRALVPVLVGAGHEVIGTTRSASKTGVLAAAGASPIVVDALNRDAVLAAVAEARPNVIIHQMTSIGATNFKNFDRSYVTTNQLRTKGVDYLLEAARAVRAERFIAQSFTGWPNGRTGATVKTEDDPLDTRPARNTEKSLAAIRYLESAVAGADIEGLVLRYGVFYGPGTAFGTSGEIVEMVAKRRMPVVGGGAGVTSFVHIDDAATATLAAVNRGASGIYNIVDDEPATVATWLPYLAGAIEAKPPRRVPAWLLRPMLGEFGVNTMTAARGSSNARAKRELGWVPRYHTWRQGFREGLG